MARTTWLALAMGLTLLGACGGDDETEVPLAGLGPGCDQQPCGGDPTGSWVTTECCADGVGVHACPGATVEYTSCEYAGTVFTFAAGGTFTQTVKGSLSATIHDLDHACNGAGSCAAHEEALLASAGVASAACSDGAAESCECQTAVKAANLTGSWSAVGDELTVVVNATTVESAFCVRGDDLWLETTDYDGAVAFRYRARRQ